MAIEMNIPDSDQTAKVRNPWLVVLWQILTIGIYFIVWWYKINKELKAFGESRGYDLGRKPVNSLLALVPGFIIIIPPLVSYWNGTKRIQGASAIAGREPINGWIVLILYLFLPIAMPAYMQSSLNNVWKQELSAAPGETPPPAPDDGALPPKLADAS